MILVDILGFLLLFLTIYIFLDLIKASLFFVYLGQLKEYRLDRLIAHFKTITGRTQLLDNFNFLKWKNFFKPRLTIRGVLTLVFIFLIFYQLFFIFLIFFYAFFKSYPQSLFLSLFLSFVSLLWLVPVFTMVGILFSGMIFFPLKLALIHLAKRKIGRMKDLQVIGITGSFGKTTTKEVIAQVLSSKYKVLKTPLNCNTLLGIANLILKKLSPDYEIFVVEMGAYRKGEIKAICDLVKPKVGILTGINQQHLELFGSFENIKKAKYELIEALPKKGLALFNANNKHTQILAKKTKKNKKLYGQLKVNFAVGKQPDWVKEVFQAAYLAADYFGIAKSKVGKEFKKLESLGPKILKGRKGVGVIDDSYNSNPDGFKSALNLLSKVKFERKILITPGIQELGNDSAKIHQELGRQAAQICERIIFTKKDFYKPFLKGVQSVKPDFKMIMVQDLKGIKSQLRKEINNKTCILLEGRVFKGLKEFLTNDRNKTNY